MRSKYEDFIDVDGHPLIKITKYYPNGCICKIFYRDKQNKVHRIGGPALIEFRNKNEIWKEKYIQNGVYHREDGPSVIEYIFGAISKTFFYLNGKYIEDELQIMIIKGSKK